MQLSNFSSAAKEILLTSIAALLIFAVVATQTADANTFEQPKDATRLVEAVSLVTELEQDVVQAKVILAKAQQAYENGELSTAEIFEVTVKYHAIENTLVESRVKLLAKLAQYKDTLGGDSLDAQLIVAD
ncbi:hypothetical protein ACOI22_09060 [Glaciecola sp. 2405UD65-10]|uniref:hypothetical protein n=1 Tax=Glaciecola sp. 2405UD65-10 TaxID=3397244 RepID=UPI003B5B8471